MTTKQAADRLGVSVRRVLFLIQLGQLPAEKRGRDWWIEDSEIEKLEQRRKDGQSEKANS